MNMKCIITHFINDTSLVLKKIYRTNLLTCLTCMSVGPNLNRFNKILDVLGPLKPKWLNARSFYKEIKRDQFFYHDVNKYLSMVVDSILEARKEERRKEPVRYWERKHVPRHGWGKHDLWPRYWPVLDKIYDFVMHSSPREWWTLLSDCPQ